MIGLESTELKIADRIAAMKLVGRTWTNTQYSQTLESLDAIRNDIIGTHNRQHKDKHVSKRKHQHKWYDEDFTEQYMNPIGSSGSNNFSYKLEERQRQWRGIAPWTTPTTWTS
eukprot:5951154-Heterocapsa_arctica.AAC.1